MDQYLFYIIKKQNKKSFIILIRSKGVDITVIPKLAAAKDFETMQLNTYKYLEDFNTEEKVLFHQMIKLLQSEMKKKYVDVSHYHF